MGQTSGKLDGKAVEITLIARRIHLRAGTRYNARGIDDQGFVGNQCEKEQILVIENRHLISHVQISGSVPLFWEQKGLKENVNLTRSLEHTKKAFILHFKHILETYGKVCCLNLLQTKTEREDLLTQGFVKLIYDPEISESRIKY